MTREELLSQAFKDENGILWIPVDTSNSDLIDLLRSGDHIVYKCKNCGLELKKYYDVRHKESTKKSLCKSCRMTGCEDRNVPIIITDKTQLDNLKYGQKFTYNCVKCNKSTTLEFRPQRKDSQYRMMLCLDCRLREKYGGVNTYFHSDAYKEENMKKYGTCYPNFNRRFKYSKWGYDCLYFASYWEFCVYLYFTEIEKDHIVIYEPLNIPYYDGDRIAYYQLDFLIDGRMIEIKGDQYLDDNGDLYFPYTKIHGEPMTKKALEARRREWANKNMCMKLHNIEVWSSKECLPIIKKVEEYFGKEWLDKFEVLPQSLSKEYKHEATLTGIVNNGYYFTKNTMPIINNYPYIKYNYGITLNEICNKNTINNIELNKSYIMNGDGIILYNISK